MNPTMIRSGVAAAAATLVLGGCYVVPIGPDGLPAYPLAVTVPQQGAPVPAPPAYAQPAPLLARLYPMNDVAAQTGVLSGTITATPGGKGHFQLSYRNETLTGEATRVSTDERRGVASAFGPSGMSMTCDYQMMHARQGAGACTFSNGARYQVHIGP